MRILHINDLKSRLNINFLFDLFLIQWCNCLIFFYSKFSPFCEIYFEKKKLCCRLHVFEERSPKTKKNICQNLPTI
jgi:hypothetical protein